MSDTPQIALITGASPEGIPPFAEVMHSGNVRIHNKGIGVFVASDDDEAKRTVTTLITDLGAEPTDAGPLSNAHLTDSPLGWLNLASSCSVHRRSVRAISKRNRGNHNM